MSLQSMILIILLICFILIGYFCSDFRINNSLSTIDNYLNKYKDKQTLDFCGSILNNKTVADFHICSSYNPYLISSFKFDYLKIEMVRKTILYGCRYIELEIINKNINNTLEPVIGISNKIGGITYSINTLSCTAVLNLIMNIAFSEKHIYNHNEPFFIFLNLKLDRHISSMNKLYDILYKILKPRLLDRGYVNTNIAKVKMCKLLGKIVLFSSDGYQNSKLEQIINMSTNNIHLRRINVSNLPNNNNLSNKNEEPYIKLSSKKLKLYNNSIIIEDNTNFNDLGIVPNMVLNIMNTKHNDTEDNVLHIKHVGTNIITLKNHTFINEKGGLFITINIFPESYDLINIHNQNKESLTIVYGDTNLINANFNSNNSFLLGCQFINMNFQIYDDNFIKYMKRFKNKYGYFSIILKSSNLRRFNNIQNKKIKSIIHTFDSKKGANNVINKLYNTFKEIKLIPKDHEESDTGCCLPIPSYKPINQLCTNLTSQKECETSQGCKYSSKMEECKRISIGLIIQDNRLIVSPVNTYVNSTFKLITGINKKTNSISIKYQDKFLVSSVNNSLTFKSHTEAFSTPNDASFLPETICTDYVSFTQEKNKKKLYLKYSNEFNYNNNLYTKRCTQFDIIKELTNDNNDILTIYKPKLSSNYKSIGDVFIKGIPDKTILAGLNIMSYMGNTQSPIGFELVWAEEANNIYIWKPKPPSGFIALGCVSTTTMHPGPSRDDYCCIGENYINENNLDRDVYWKNDNINNKLSIWDVGGYYICNNLFTQPSRFVRPVYIIITTEEDGSPKNIHDSLYLEEITDYAKINNACFGILDVVDKTIPDIDMSNFSVEKYKSNNQITFVDKTLKCIGVPNIYWGNTDTQYRLKAIECNASYPGTNFVMYKNKSVTTMSGITGMIRFKNDITNCIEMNDTGGKTKLIRKKCNGQEFQQFLYNNSKLSNKDDSKSLYYNSGDNSLIMSSPTERGGDTSYKPIIVSVSNNLILKNCININDKVYMKLIIERKHNFDINDIQEDNTIVENILNEEINRIYIETYVLYTVTKRTDTTYTLLQFSNNQIQDVNIDTELYMNTPPDQVDLKIGNEVLFEHGGIIGHEESTVKWKGIINGVDYPNVDIISSINSYEPNGNNLSLGRPRIRKKITKSKDDIVMLVPTIFCDL